MQRYNRVHAIFNLVLVVFFLMYDQFMRAAPQVEESFAIPGLHIKHLFGFITTITVYAFIFAQIPVGILFDRFNIRILLPFAIFCSSLGMYLMGWSVYPVISFIAKCFLMVGAPFASYRFL